MTPDIPAKSDHLGICLDINVEALFDSTYSDLGSLPRWKLTLNNVRAKTSYIKYILLHFHLQYIWEKVNDLYKIAAQGIFNDHYETRLTKIDDTVTNILREGEDNCAPRIIGRDPWSPVLRTKGRTLSYWQKKTSMLRKRHIRWDILQQKLTGTKISTTSHLNTTLEHAIKELRKARKAWRQTKKDAAQLRDQFLNERAEVLAAKTNSTHEKAL